MGWNTHFKPENGNVGPIQSSIH